MIDFKKLRDIREDNDLNQRKMAKILHVKRSTYSLWELGINIIPLEKLCEFADYFNYSIDYVLGLSRKRNTKRISHGIDFLVLGKKIKKIARPPEGRLSSFASIAISFKISSCVRITAFLLSGKNFGTVSLE